MPRWRLGVALLVSDPVRHLVDGLRRALGDPALPRIPAHLTLVPPVNVREDEVPAALAVLRTAAADQPPLHLTLGPPATFLPHNPVVYLAVAGNVAGLQRLRDAVFAPPLERPLTWPFVPHVTICDDTTPERIEAALAALADFAVEVRIDAVHLLREHDGRVWKPIADVPFAGTAVANRGSLAVELATSDRLDPEAAAFAATAWPTTPRPLAITARRDGQVVGVAEGRTDGPHAHLSNLVVDPDHRGTGVGAQLVNAFLAEAQRRGATAVTARTKTEGFYQRLGWDQEARLSDGFVQFVRNLPPLP